MLGFPVSNSYLRIRRAKFTKILSKTDIVKPINKSFVFKCKIDKHFICLQTYGLLNRAGKGIDETDKNIGESPGLPKIMYLCRKLGCLSL